jgi:dUTP pyrophosphatase
MEVKKLEKKSPAACKACYSKYLYEDKRDEKVTVECEFQVSEKCNKFYEISLGAEQKNRKKNNGRYICLQCSRVIKYSSRKNLNYKYDIPTFFFADIDNEFKAYILGQIASNGVIFNGGFSIYGDERDLEIISKIRNIICEDIPIRSKGNLVGITICSEQISWDLYKHLQISPSKKSSAIMFPHHLDDNLKWDFVRGFFDGDGGISSIYSRKSFPQCFISNNSTHMLHEIFKFVNIPGYLGYDKIEWSGNNALDFLGNIYDKAGLKLKRKYERYIDWCLWQPDLLGHHGKSDTFRWTKTDENAVSPFKSKVSDAGYDITIIKKIKTVGDVEFYDTGIKIQPDFGYYFDLVPRSSISKTGYMLANCVGIIDRTYIGPVIVALRKVDKNAKDIELPCRIAQIIPRHIVHLQIEEVEELDKTARGAGGFGSTGDK